MVECRRGRRWGTKLLSGRRRPLKIAREQPLQHLVIADLGRPAVGGEDGGVERCVEVGEPGGAFVVEIRQRALA